VWNHADLERHLLDMALEYSLFPSRIDELLNHARRSTSRRLANYLATAWLYVDQVQHDISEALQDGGRSVARIREVMNAQYNDRLGYRAMEALRNHAQHRGLPVNAISFPIVREERFKPARLRFSVVPAVGVRELAQDVKFKHLVLEELERRANGNGLVALMPLLRQNSEGLRAVHSEVRIQLKAPLEAAERVFRTLTEQAAQAFEGDTRFLSAIRYNEDGTFDESERLTSEYSERRRELETKNHDLGAIADRFVSSE
jgi:hypothetical protein